MHGPGDDTEPEMEEVKKRTEGAKMQRLVFANSSVLKEFHKKRLIEPRSRKTVH